jgi:hypothetical protein
MRTSDTRIGPHLYVRWFTDRQRGPTKPYEEFIRARSLAHTKEGVARNLLNGRQDSAATMLSACLNQLIGLVSRDLGADENQDIRAIDAVDFTTTEPQAPFDPDRSSKATGDKPRTRSKNAEDRATAKKMQVRQRLHDLPQRFAKGYPRHAHQFNLGKHSHGFLHSFSAAPIASL